MRGLDIGCGPDFEPDDRWTRVDIQPYPGAIVADAADGLPFASGSFDEAVANHVLQMIPAPRLLPWLSEVRRILDTDGCLRLILPDLLGAVAAWREGRQAWFPLAESTAPTLDAKLCIYVSQAGATRSVFTPGYALDLLTEAGFDAAAVVSPGRTASGWPDIVTLDSRADESIVVEGYR